MKGYLKIAFIIFVSFTLACKKEDYEPEVFQVEVIGEGMDCGDIFLVQFDEADAKRLGKSVSGPMMNYPIVYANNLPEEFKVPGIILKITLGKCENTDVVGCTAMGPAFGHICIDEAERVSLNFLDE